MEYPSKGHSYCKGIFGGSTISDEKCNIIKSGNLSPLVILQHNKMILLKAIHLLMNCHCFFSNVFLALTVLSTVSFVLSCIPLSKFTLLSSRNLHVCPEGVRLSSDSSVNSKLANYLSIESQFGCASLRLLNNEEGKVEIKHSGKGFAVILQNNRRVIRASYVYPDENYLLTGIPFEIPPNDRSFETIELYDHFLLGVPLDENLAFEDASKPVSNAVATIINDRNVWSNSMAGQKEGESEYFVNLSRSIEGTLQEVFFKGKYYLIVGRFLKNQPVHCDSLLPNQLSRLSLINGSTFQPKSISNRPLYPSLLNSFLSELNSECCLGTTYRYNLDHLAGRTEDKTKNILIYVAKDLDSGASAQLRYEMNRNRLVCEISGLANVLVIRPLAGLLFPAKKDFLQKNIYSSTEQTPPTIIEPTLLPGDLILIFIPICNGKHVNVSPEELLQFFTSDVALQSPECIMQQLQSQLKTFVQNFFVSLSKLEEKKV